MTPEQEDPLRAGQRATDDMEERLDQLQEDIGTARSRARDRREEADPEGVAGDWEDESVAAPTGDEPEGGFDDPEAEDDDEE